MTREELDVLIAKYIDGDLSTSEAEAFMAELKASEPARALLARHLYHERTIQNLLAPAPATAQKPRKRAWILAAAAAALLAVSAALYFTGAPAPFATVERLRGRVSYGGTAIHERQSFDRGVKGLTTEGGASARVLFQDGTSVLLESDTAVDVEEGERGKRVSVTQGGVLADVTPQPAERAMILAWSRGQAKVLGTTLRLSVNRDPKVGTRLDVEKGKVELKNLEGRTVLVTTGHFSIAAPDVDMTPRPIARHPLSWVEDRVREWRPTASERKFDLIGWAPDLRAALALAKKHNRPLFIFAHGGRVAAARCGGGTYGMRLDALSNDHVISLLNSSFVPVLADAGDYDTPGRAPAEEKGVLNRIYQAATAKGLDVGNERAYLCAPDGDPVGFLDSAAGPAAAALTSLARKLGVTAGPTLVPPRPQNPRPATTSDALALHLTARSVPGGHEGTGFWHGLPGEDWIVYSREEWSKFLPAPGATRWDVDRAVALKLLNHFFPTVENSDVRTNEIEEASMKASLVASDRIRLDASLKMKHPDLPPDGSGSKAVGSSVTATAVGVVEFDPATRTIRRFVLATEKATYSGKDFGVAVRSEVAP